MELTENIESLNNQLIDLFGIDSLTGQSIWRIVFSEYQFEKRLGTYDDFTPNGLYIRTVTEVREVPKYRQWIQEKYVLERLVVVPEVNIPELPTSRVSYEPIFVFEDKYSNYLPPRLDAAKFVIDTIYAAQYENHSLAKYKDPESSQENALELQKERVDELVEAIFGDSTDISEAITRKEGIFVPHNYKRES
jgi:hypothetical protein